MPPDLFEASATAEAFTSDVAAFAAAQPSEKLAVLICFFHLVDLHTNATIDLRLEESGRMILTIEAESRRD